MKVIRKFDAKLAEKMSESSIVHCRHCQTVLVPAKIGWVHKEGAKSVLGGKPCANPEPESLVIRGAMRSAESKRYNY